MKDGATHSPRRTAPALRVAVLAAAVAISASLTGCQFKTASAASPEGGKPAAFAGNAVSEISPQAATQLVATSVPSARLATQTAPAVENALEKAHQEYLNAYERYVQYLRERGPHSLDTLNALADYQKKYQLYQRMQSAGRE